MEAHELRGSDGGACSTTVTSSLLGVRGSPGAGDQVPSTNEVLLDTKREVQDSRRASMLPSGSHWRIVFDPVPKIGMMMALACPSHGWQHDASGKVTDDLMNRVWPRLSEPSRALLRSQGGTMSRVSYSCCIGCHQLLRCLWLPLPLSAHSCRCGRPLDDFGHPPRSVCSSWGVGSPGILTRERSGSCCREAGGRVSVNVFVIQGMDAASCVCGGNPSICKMLLKHRNTL